MSEQTKTTESPDNANDAWWQYWAENLQEGMNESNWVDEAHEAFLSGWKAALANTQNK